MKHRLILVAAAALVACAAAGPVQAAFNAADLVYVPVVAHTTGLNDSVWRSDVSITNVGDTDAIDVALVFLPSGIRDNSSLFDGSRGREDWVGGRDSDGFGTVDPVLADIPPGGTVVLEDVVETYWPDSGASNGQGALVVFSYLADTLEDNGSRTYRDCVVNSRTFNIGTVYQPDPDNEGEFLELEGTFGQNIAGVPWYNLADPAAVLTDEDDNIVYDFSFEILDFGREDDAFRYNLGMVNVSDLQTSLTMSIEPIAADGSAITGAEGNGLNLVVNIPPLAHVQYSQILSTIFSQEDLDQARFKVSVLQWTSQGVETVPAFISYGSLVDNVTNDPMTVMPTFAYPYDTECMWNPRDAPNEGPPNEEENKRRGVPGRVTARPIGMPAR
jgi:hypothetical protein